LVVVAGGAVAGLLVEAAPVVLLAASVPPAPVVVPAAGCPTGAGFRGDPLAGGGAGLAVLKASPLCLAQKKAIKHSAIQIDAAMIVIRVNTSPAFAPNALEPPMPPSAPAKPPPRPRCTNTSRIKKIASSERTTAKSISAMCWYHVFRIQEIKNAL
jgi:hypothetical protein